MVGTVQAGLQSEKNAYITVGIGWHMENKSALATESEFKKEKRSGTKEASKIWELKKWEQNSSYLQESVPLDLIH